MIQLHLAASGDSAMCGVTLAQEHAEQVKSWTAYKDHGALEQMLTELLTTAP